MPERRAARSSGDLLVDEPLGSLRQLSEASHGPIGPTLYERSRLGFARHPTCPPTAPRGGNPLTEREISADVRLLGLLVSPRHPNCSRTARTCATLETPCRPATLRFTSCQAPVADASAVDSTVLDLLHGQEPSLKRRLRIVESLGPSPRPPWVVGRAVPHELRAAVRGALLAMASDPRGGRVLASGMASRFAVVTDSDYDSMRCMAQESDRVEL